MVVAVAVVAATTTAPPCLIPLVLITLSYGNPDRRCNNKKRTKMKKEKRSEAKRRRKVRLMRYFSIITSADASRTIRSVLMEYIVYSTVYPYGFVPHTIVIIVLCRDIWCKIKVDKEK